jgi:hypothetical protein
VALAGKLEDFGLPVLLQMLASSERTGRLILTRRDGHGVVLFRRGRIVYAATNSVREAIGSILLRRGLLTEAALYQAIERWNMAAGTKRLGAVLVEMGLARNEDLEDVMRHQTGTVIAELLRWPRGFFRFEKIAIPEGSEVEVDARDFVVAEGLTTGQVLFEALSSQETPEGEESAAASEGGPQPARSLPELVPGLHPPSLRAEVTLGLMNAARDAFARGLLFVLRDDAAEVIAHFGFPGAGPEEGARILLAECSALSDATHSQAPLRTQLRAGHGDDALLRLLGTAPPDGGVLIPVRAGGRALLALYGDNATAGRPVAPTPELERTAAGAGRAIERDALEARLRELALLEGA